MLRTAIIALAAAVLALAAVGPAASRIVVEHGRATTRSAAVALTVPQVAGVTLTRLAVKLARTGPRTERGPSLQVAVRLGDLPARTTVLARIISSGPARALVDLVVVRRGPAAEPDLRRAGGSTTRVGATITAEWATPFTLRLRRLTDWATRPALDAPAPICRGGKAAGGAFGLVAGELDSTVVALVPGATGWRAVADRVLCTADVAGAGLLNAAGCGFAADDVGTTTRVVATCLQELSGLELGSARPIAQLVAATVRRAGGAEEQAACQLAAGRVRCPGLLAPGDTLVVDVGLPATRLDVEVVPSASARATYRLS